MYPCNFLLPVTNGHTQRPACAPSNKLILQSWDGVKIVRYKGFYAGFMNTLRVVPVTIVLCMYNFYGSNDEFSIRQVSHFSFNASHFLLDFFFFFPNISLVWLFVFCFLIRVKISACIYICIYQKDGKARNNNFL